MRWRRIACLGCLLILVVVLGLTFVFFDTVIDLFKLEFTRSNLQPIPNSTAAISTLGSKQVNDLSYVQTLAIGYTDDADPEYDGISVDITFFDSKSEIISFSDIPFNLKIEIYAYRDPLNMFDFHQGDLVYEGSISLDHSMRLGEMAGNYIRIPYNDLPIDMSRYQPFGTMRVVVSLPAQGEFEATEDLVPLGPYEDRQ
jgi:hypothetical protein